MIEFILNGKKVKTDKPKGMTLVDFIRDEALLKGTKIGCREGDCGACTVMMGTLEGNEVEYKTITSCITPLVKVHRKHIVTIEGLGEKITKVQDEIVKNSATQCGFCTPGFVMSLSNSAISSNSQDLKYSVSGNICRCTGYKSIEKAVDVIEEDLKKRSSTNKLKWAIDNNYFPDYFKDIPSRLFIIENLKENTDSNNIIAGATDLYVRKANKLKYSSLKFIGDNDNLKGILIANNTFKIGASTTVSELLESKEFTSFFPEISKQFLLISSPQIRNVATIAGNIVNASPIGDISVFFLALDASLTIENLKSKEIRTVHLKNFFLDYKKYDLSDEEIIISIKFDIPKGNHFFNFEKVSKRTHLDIASVNTAISIVENEGYIESVHLSAGGIAPIPKYFKKTSGFLTGMPLMDHTIRSAVEVLFSEISPISDIRGTKEYKELLLRQLFYSHFLKLFPEYFSAKEMVEF